MFKKIPGSNLAHSQARFAALMCGGMALLIAVAVFVGGGGKPFTLLSSIVSPNSQTARICDWTGGCNGTAYVPSCGLYANGADADISITRGQGVTLNWVYDPGVLGGGGSAPDWTYGFLFAISNVGSLPANLNGAHQSGAVAVYPTQTTTYVFSATRHFWSAVQYDSDGNPVASPSDIDYCASYANSGSNSFPSHFMRTIYVSVPTYPTLSISVAPNPIGYGGSTGVFWSASGGQGFDACYLGGGNWGGGVGVPASGASGSGGLSGSTTFWLQCHDTYYGWLSPAYATVTMNPPAGPTMNLSVSPNPVGYGNGTGVFWSATGGANYDACYLGGGQWGGGVGVAVGGSSPSIGLTTNTQYWFQCHDIYYGWVTPAYATVTVNPPPAPTQTISASPTSITAGNGTTVSWSATTGASFDACYLGSTSGPWVGGVPVGTGGSSGTGPLYTNTSFAFQCHDTYYGWLNGVWASVAVNNAACPNGSGYSGSCTACNNGYVLSGGNCVLQCTNGSGPAGACTACNAGYILSAGSCTLQCPNGSGPAGACTSCNSGYTLLGGSCVIPSIGTFSITPSRIRKNTASTITFSYTVTNPAGSCTISGPAGFTPITFTPGNGVPGTQQGSVTIAQATNFTLTCGAVSAQATVSLIPITREL